MTNKQKLIFASMCVGLMVCVFSYRDFTSSDPIFVKNFKKDERVVEKIASYMENEGLTLGREKLLDTARSIYKVSKEYKIDYRLILAIIKVESSFKHDVVSPKGARGLLQIKPSLAKFIARQAGVHWNGKGTLDEPEKNIRIGTFFFSKLLEDFDNVHLALNAYNMGPTRLKSILNEKNKYNGSFSRQVIKEYKNISTMLPPP